MSIVCYIPMLEGQSDEVCRFLEQSSKFTDVIPVILPQTDWNNDLTPWPSQPVFKKGKPFGGNSLQYLDRLVNEVIPSIEKDRGLIPDERWICGVSLSGLFAVWATANTGLFDRIAAISGSFWYPGFTEWLEKAEVNPNVKSAYISLGDKESNTKNPNMQSIAEDTARIVEIFESKGVRTQFEWNEGSHFASVVPRLDKALQALISMSNK